MDISLDYSTRKLSKNPQLSLLFTGITSNNGIIMCVVHFRSDILDYEIVPTMKEELNSRMIVEKDTQIL